MPVATQPTPASRLLGLDVVTACRDAVVVRARRLGIMAKSKQDCISEAAQIAARLTPHQIDALRAAYTDPDGEHDKAEVARATFAALPPGPVRYILRQQIARPLKNA